MYAATFDSWLIFEKLCRPTNTNIVCGILLSHDRVPFPSPFHIRSSSQTHQIDDANVNLNSNFQQMQTTNID